MTLPLEAVRGETAGTGLFRLLAVAFRRYSREPETRVAAARMILATAINLYAKHTTAGEAALLTAETLAEIGRAERQCGRRG